MSFSPQYMYRNRTGDNLRFQRRVYQDSIRKIQVASESQVY